jgi:sirohydrochlorin cobaltochelatase
LTLKNSAIAYLLVAHGSRDPRPQATVTQFADDFAQVLATADAMTFPELAPQASPPVGTAQLECAPLSLHQQIVEFGRSLPGDRPCRLVILPLFLLPGVHVMEDLPAEVALAQADLGDEVQIEVRPYLGTQARLRRLVREQMAAVPVQAWILLAHGSRRSQGNQPVIDLAQDLGALPAYWSVSPSVAERLAELQAQGCEKIGILPYFLFTGGTTDAIAIALEQLAQQFPSLSLHRAQPLDAHPALVQVLLDMALPQVALTSLTGWS